MKCKTILIFVLFIFVFSLNAANNEKDKPNYLPVMSEAKALSVARFDISLPLRLISPKPIVALGKRGGLIKDPGNIQKNNIVNDSDALDPVVQTQTGVQRIPAPLASFNALSNIAGVNPPDPNADVGLNHVVVMSNLSFHILDKSGVSVFGPAANNTVWSGFGGDCENDNSGDPVVLYDQIADRWLLSQFTASGPEYFNCVAVSTSGDPTGSYYRWAVSNGTLFPDYPKYGIWSDGYYISTRDFNGNSFVSVGVYALKREDMIAGNPSPAIVYMSENRTSNSWRVGDGLLPADIDGFDLPPANAPEYFIGTMDDGANYGAAEDALLLWQFDVDFNTPANSTFTLTDILSIAAFDTIFPCSSGRNCIPQKDTSNEVDIQSYRQRPLHRLAYRNFGTHESLVTNQSVEGAPGIAGVRWWEVRNPSTNPVLFQEGTYAPGATDDIHRWMGSAAMDSGGNIAIAYSASGDSIFPAIRYTGRLSGDTLGTMTQGEESIVEGLGSQTGSQRWGDYTSLTVDPVDDCTFWHVNEYYETSSSNGWELRVGAFKFDECGTPGFYLRASASTQSICVADDASYDLTIGSVSGFSAPVTLSVAGLPSPSIEGYLVNPIPTQPSSTQFTIINTASVIAGTYALELTGTATGAETKTTNLELNVFDNVPVTPSLTSPTDTQDNVDIMPSLNWTGDQTILYTIELATDLDFNNIIFTGTTSGNTIVPTVSLNTSSVYYWRVKANNSCGDGSYSSIFSFRTVPAPGDCNQGFVTSNTINEDFEAGLNGWTTDALVGFNTWVNSSVSSNSGTKSMLVTDVAEVADQILTSPLIQLPTGQSPLTLQFWNKQTLEDGTNVCYDGGLLEISVNGGLSFNQISNDKLLTDTYDGPVSDSYSNPLATKDAWCGDPQDWLNSIVDINAYAGQNVMFRFRLGTDSSVDREGWYIDDVIVQSCVIDLIYKDGFETIIQ